jgi:hypothetical protein
MAPTCFDKTMSSSGSNYVNTVCFHPAVCYIDNLVIFFRVTQKIFVQKVVWLYYIYFKGNMFRQLPSLGQHIKHFIITIGYTFYASLFSSSDDLKSFVRKLAKLA